MIQAEFWDLHVGKLGTQSDAAAGSPISLGCWAQSRALCPNLDQKEVASIFLEIATNLMLGVMLGHRAIRTFVQDARVHGALGLVVNGQG